jgi:hypothetical protein
VAAESTATGSVTAGIDGSAALLLDFGPEGGTESCTYTTPRIAALGLYSLEVSAPGYASATVTNVYTGLTTCSAEPEGEKVVVLLHPTGA